MEKYLSRKLRLPLGKLLILITLAADFFVRCVDNRGGRCYIMVKVIDHGKHIHGSDKAGWWIGWIEEVPGVNCQERTREELLASLRTTLAEALELNRQEAIQAAAPDYTEELVTV